MDRASYLRAMQFPTEWESWAMIPEEWLEGAMSTYEPGAESAPEHDRHGAFQWWLKNSPDKNRLIRLAQLSLLDPDQDMASYVRDRIRESDAYCDQVEAILSDRE